LAVHPSGEPPVDAWSATADTFAGRVRVEWDDQVAVTPLGRLPFFIDYLKRAGLFDEWVADCPLHLIRPNAPSKRDLLGTLMLSVLAGQRRYAHITALRCDFGEYLTARHEARGARGLGPPRADEDRRNARSELAPKSAIDIFGGAAG